MSEFDISQIAPVYYHNNCKECGKAFWTIIAQKDVCPKCEGYLTKDGEQECCRNVAINVNTNTVVENTGGKNAIDFYGG